MRRLIVPVLAVVLLGGCAVPTVSPSYDVDLPSQERLFASRPAAADCSRVDVAGLDRITGADQPIVQAVPLKVTVDESAVPVELPWPACVGRQRSTAAGAAAGASDAASAQSAAAVAGAAEDGSTPGPLVWVVSYAGSAAAATDSVVGSPLVGEPDVRTVIRATRLGPARAQVQLSVHADDHVTLVLVSVFDPQSDRAAAQCGVVGVPGDRADDVVDWCLHAIRGQLIGRPAATRAPASTLAPVISG